ncbi:polysaccharide deacetylase family protein [Anaerolineales bacterium HSG6]|nr:polysaccharide deacetylase family protein [Anaerolineales bacterium HSG6]MDM8530394.1 polysaccharide deacetylase family protein [Anaerolineales bacterium HSG25]
MNPITLAIHGKGVRKAVERGLNIVGRYGFNTRKMDQSLNQFTNVLHRFDCNATFPITTVAARRHIELVKKYQDKGIEFAVHGLRHLDHSELDYEDQQSQLAQALQIFKQNTIQVQGFRGPYLRWNGDTLSVLRENGFIYDSSASLTWDVVGEYDTPSYQHVLQFYGARSATNYPSLPVLDNQVVRIPYSLPDDEALVERLDLPPESMKEVWLEILSRTHRLGEIFTIGLHPERIYFCQEALEAVLATVEKLEPAVWVARLDEIATWWSERTQTRVEITDIDHEEFRIDVSGPEGLTILARGVEVNGPTEPWFRSYDQIQTNEFNVIAQRRPFIGLDPHASPKLASFLRQQGYIIEYSTKRELYAYYFDQPQFVPRHKRFLLAQIEGTNFPLVRLSRWPNGTQSAISITGDIDALSVWDYFLRLFGR